MALVREDYYYLCRGNQCTAMILNEFEKWMNFKIRKRYKDLWIWKSQDDLRAEILWTFGSKKIRASIEWLVKNQYLLQRRHPTKNWDKVYQYIINIEKVNEDLDKIADMVLKIKEEKIIDQKLVVKKIKDNIEGVI